MHVEDSKHHIYIYDLDEELAGADSDEERLIFLPDIEKKLATLPKSILTSETAPKGNEVVLYTVPESLSVPRDQDNVRKAIIESRARARETQSNGLTYGDWTHKGALVANTDRPDDSNNGGLDDMDMDIG